MTGLDVISALMIAGVALYGLGFPIAWLLPAPDSAQWLHRVAIAPVYAILVGYLVTRLLSTAGIPLHPLQAACLLVGAWVTAVWRRRGAFRRPVSMRPAALPTVLVLLAAGLWVKSLVGFGLYLPNRDFKNHSYLVAMTSFFRSADPESVGRQSPMDPASSLFSYPIGLHALLGWSLPTPGWSAVGVTAAAAVLVTTVSLPLAFVSFARMWAPMPRGLDAFAGLVGICLPGLTFHFAYGSVVLLAGAALFASALSVGWLAMNVRSPKTVLALGMSVVGLLAMHVAEGLALALVVVIHSGLSCRLVVGKGRVRSVGFWTAAGIAVALGGLIVATAWPRIVALAQWAPAALDTVRLDAASSVFGLFIALSGSATLVAAAWFVLTVVGVWRTGVDGRSTFPITVLCTTGVMVVLATWEAVPTWARLATAPWYGNGTRVALLAGAPMAVLAGLALVSLSQSSVRRPPPLGRAFLGVRALLAALAVALLLHGLDQIVKQRRANLSSTLAGAGDTAAIAERLAHRLGPGQSVLNLEADGSAQLFSYSRVPVLAGLGYSSLPTEAGLSVPTLVERLMQLDDPDVAKAMADLNVTYVVLGTTSLYWDPSVGYSLELLARQPELKVEMRGSDLTVMRYEP